MYVKVPTKVAQLIHAWVGTAFYCTFKPKTKDL